MICVLQFDAASVARRSSGCSARGGCRTSPRSSARGRRLELETPAVDFAAGAFYTLYSGVELGDHGDLLSVPVVGGRAAGALRDRVRRRRPRSGSGLRQSGLRTLAIDPYESRPPQRAEGVFVCGWGFADRVVLPRWSRPGGRGPRVRAALRPRAPAPPRSSAARARATCWRCARSWSPPPAGSPTLAEELLARESFDLAWLTFSAAHLAGHQFWDLSQLDAAALDAGGAGDA